MKKVLVSACLLGERVRYDGQSLVPESELLKDWLAQGRVVSVCPEVDGGMSVPRDPAEIRGGDGKNVLAGQAQVVQQNGVDVSDSFIRGAELALSLCREHQIQVAVLSESSPSCGSTTIHSGTFSGHKVPGEGVTTALLRRNGVKVYNQHQIVQANQQLLSLPD